jgi:hypothetical protein
LTIRITPTGVLGEYAALFVSWHEERGWEWVP